MAKEIQAQTVHESSLHKLVSSLYDMQHTRILIENRFRGTSNNQLIAFVEGMNSLEKNVKGIIKGEVQQYPIHEWIISQKGLSYDLAGQLIGLIQNIERFSNVSKLWAYAGMGTMEVCQTCGKQYYLYPQKSEKIIHISKRLSEQYSKKKVKEGRADFTKKAKDMLCSCQNPNLKTIGQRKLTGSLITYNPTLKMLCYKIGVQFVKQGGLYRKLYDKYRAEYEQREDLQEERNVKKGKKTKNGTSKGTAHIHNMAQRKAVKVFLSHLWLKWRELDGLPTTDPYVIGVMGHSHYIYPE